MGDMCWMVALVAFSGLVHTQAHPCNGGPVASCRCILSCQVFGAQPQLCNAKATPDQIDVAVNTQVEASLKKTPEDGTDPECEGITCIARCAKSLGCLDHDVEGKCYNVKENKEGCHVDCDDARRTTGTVPWFSVALAVMAFSSSTDFIKR
mmetsp:Transcript_13552/g.31878  ORF Transcript_13552/g.31878 Transcript_13552/m.31878 type:complete len:151 (-) Transcript_13552:156-608(-)